MYRLLSIVARLGLHHWIEHKKIFFQYFLWYYDATWCISTTMRVKTLKFPRLKNWLCDSPSEKKEIEKIKYMPIMRLPYDFLIKFYNKFVSWFSLPHDCQSFDLFNRLIFSRRKIRQTIFECSRFQCFNWHCGRDPTYSIIIS